MGDLEDRVACPQAIVDDATFLRRAYLDAIGTLPSPEGVSRFLDSENPEKRSELIDQVVGQVGEVSRREMLDLSVFAVRVSEEMGDVRLAFVAFCDRGYVNGAFVLAHGRFVADRPDERNSERMNFWLQMENTRC